MATGFLTEGLNIQSEVRFDEMVEEYSGLAGEPELVHLKAYWAQYYHVTFTQAPLPVLSGREDGADMIDLEEGQELNDSYCLECHARPDNAFLSVPVAKLGSGLAPWLSRFRADRVMYWIHFGLALTLVLFFPFSRMFHLVAVPLASMGRRMTPEKMRTDMGFLDLAALSACTHCGYCSQVCSVYPDYQITENPQVLPHVKIETLKRLAGKGVWDLTTLTRLRSGNGDCTLCGMCGDICPSGIDLVKLWVTADHLMDCLGCPDNYTTAMETSFEQWTGSRPEGVPAQGLGRDGGDGHDPEQDAGQVIGLARQANAFEHCVQCTLCTNACPVVAYDLNQNDMGPHQIMNLLRLGEQGMASGSKMVWHCLTCYSCQEVCPQSIRVADILLELRCQGQVRAAELTLHRLRGEDS
jgi:heterodisulfide reductase subunit C